MTTLLPPAFAPVHDELVADARTTLLAAASRLDGAHEAPEGVAEGACREAIELAVLALELLHRAELAAIGVHEATR
jgi:hypothetical protein